MKISMNWTLLKRGGEDWWASRGTDGWATCVVVSILLGFYAVRIFSKPFLRLFQKEKSSEASTSSNNGHCVETVNGNAPIVTETDLQKLLLLLDESGHSDGPNWIPVVDKHSEKLSYNAKLREPEDGTPTEYLSTSLFRNCSCACLKDFYMDSEYRLKWDKTLESYELLHADEKTASEIGRFIRKFPFIRHREYVLCWRQWQGEDGSFYYFAKHCEHTQAPIVVTYTRIQHYMSGWQIQQVGDDCKIKMWHQEDTTSTAKMAFSYSIWKYMCDMEKNLRRYQCTQHRGPQNKAQDIPKVPAVLLTSLPKAFQASTQSNANKVCKKRKLSIRKSGKWMANSMLFLGGAMFFARRPAPVGAKIAAFYAIQKLVKPSTTSVRPIPQHYPIL